jgi:hypothetical protein
MATKEKTKTGKIDKNCLTCSLYLTCENKKKSFTFSCGKYSSFEKAETKKKAKKKEKEKIKKSNIVIKIKKDKRGEYDFEDLAEDVIEYEKTSPLPRDLKIDDRDIPQAPNLYTFLTSPKYLNIEPYPFAKQLEIGTKMFAEYCPKCSNTDYINCVPVRHKPEKFLENVQLLKFGVCPKCKGTKSEFHADGLLKVPCELAGMAGQRAAKSQTFGMLSAYHIHSYLKNPSPQRTYNLLPMTDLHGQFTALTWQKAKDLLWDPIYGYLKNSRFFTDYYEVLDHYGAKFGEELYQVKDTFARYRHRHLFLYPVGPDKNKLRGTTAFIGGIDEIGLFSVEENSTKVKMNGEEVYTSMRNSFRTLRSAYYKLLRKGYNSLLPPMLGCISSPLNKKDMIVKLYDRSQTSKYATGFHYATWEMNPYITKKDLEQEFIDDPIKALRDFGAVPPNSSAPYIEDIEQVAAIVNRKATNAFKINTSTAKSKSGKEHTTGKVVFNQLPDGNKRILAIDAGEKNNSFAIVTGYWDSVLERPVFDGIGEIQPKPLLPLNFTFLYEDVLVPIIERMNVQIVVADRWQSTKILSDLIEECDIEAEQYSVKYPEFTSLQADIINGNINIPKPEMDSKSIEKAGEEAYPNGFIGKPISHFVFQLLSVQDNLKAVTKGEGTTDDILRALVLGYSFLIDPDYRELLSGKTAQQQVVTTALGAVGAFGTGAKGSAASHNLGMVASRGGSSSRR